ncbi:MAG: hypothetical protein HFG54_09305 [Lachnospiraceae bacterium]|jgi:hypothetical protein|nr:hypothetical protein [Lachnospiraceae bacterium]
MEGSKSLSDSLKPIRTEERRTVKPFGASPVASGVDLKRAKGVFVKAVSAERTGLSKSQIQRKLQKIRRKLLSGARLTGEEKEFLRRYAPELYRQAIAIERERASYEEQLKAAKTREEAEHIQTAKMAGSIGMAGKDSSVFQQIRAAQLQAANQELQIKILAKPWKKDLESKKKRMKKAAEEQAHRERRMKRLRRWDDGKMVHEISDEKRLNEEQERALLDEAIDYREQLKELAEEQMLADQDEEDKRRAMLTEKRAIVYGDGAATAASVELDSRPQAFKLGKAAYSAAAQVEREKQEEEKDGKYIRKA